MTQLSRRQFIRMTAFAGVAAVGGASLSRALTAPQQPVRIQETRLLLGSITNLTVISTDAKQARAAITAAFDRMAALESVLSRFQPQSQISQLNTSGRVNAPHPALRDVLERAVYYGDLTGGAFDVTIEPVLQVYREQARSGQLPTAAAVESARQYVDYHGLKLTPDAIYLEKPGMAVTLDGIGKGYIIDQGAAVFGDYGLDQVMVELGGDLQTRGQAGARPWRVAIQQPDLSNNTSLVAEFSQAALATSGDYLYTFTPDRRNHHILDPKNGISPPDLASVSVLAPTTANADALSTAVMVMGAKRGLKLIESLPDTEALVISKAGTVQQTAHFPL